jgi:hypothetical protein
MPVFSLLSTADQRRIRVAPSHLRWMAKFLKNDHCTTLLMWGMRDIPGLRDLADRLSSIDQGMIPVRDGRRRGLLHLKLPEVLEDIADAIESGIKHPPGILRLRGSKTPHAKFNRREKASPETDWRRAVNAHRWFSLACETPLPDPASEKYEQIASPSVRLRQTLDVCPCDIRAFWAAKSSFWTERHRQRERARLAGGEDWIRTRGCVSPEIRPGFRGNGAVSRTADHLEKER